MTQRYPVMPHRRPRNGGVVWTAMAQQVEDTFVEGPVHGTENSAHRVQLALIAAVEAGFDNTTITPLAVFIRISFLLIG